jgi:ferredoxin
VIEFESRTGKVIIDDSKCCNCGTYACVKACSLYGAHLFRINLKEKKPEPLHPPEDLKRMCTECLACEQECFLRGLKAITIELPIPGLSDYRKKMAAGV